MYRSMNKNMKIFVTFALVFISLGTFAQTSSDDKLAKEYFNLGEFDKAVIYFEKLADKNPDVQEYHQNLLTCYIQLEDWKKAEKYLKKKIKQDEREPSYQVELGYIFKLWGEDKKAKSIFESAIKNVIPTTANIQTLAGSLLKAGEPELAIKAFKEGEKINGDGIYSFEIADIYRQLGNVKAVIGEMLSILKASPAALGRVQAAFTTILDDNPESELNKELRNELLKEIQKNPSQIVFQELLIWLYIQQNNFENAFNQARALDKRNKEDGTRILELARIAAENERTDLALDMYEYIIEKGKSNYIYSTARFEQLQLLRAQLENNPNFKIEDAIRLKNAYYSAIDELKSKERVAEIYISLANLIGFYLDDYQGGVRILEKLLEDPTLQPQLKAKAQLELADLLILTGDVWEPSILYGQVEKNFKNDLVGQDAKFRNARLAYFRKEFEWADIQLKVLKASTSKLFANDALALSLLINDNSILAGNFDALELFAEADLLTYLKQYESALKKLDSIPVIFPGHSILDDVYYRKAELYSKMKDFDKAIFYYKKVANEFPKDVLADDALMKLAKIYELVVKDKEQAMETYKLILTNYPGSLFTTEARKRFRLLNQKSQAQ